MMIVIGSRAARRGRRYGCRMYAERWCDAFRRLCCTNLPMVTRSCHCQTLATSSLILT